MNKFLTDLFTGVDGITYDPARVIGYGWSIVSGVAFLGFYGYTVIHTGIFNGSEFAMGSGAMAANLVAAAAGVHWKRSTEPNGGG